MARRTTRSLRGTWWRITRIVVAVTAAFPSAAAVAQLGGPQNSQVLSARPNESARALARKLAPGVDVRLTLVSFADDVGRYDHVATGSVAADNRKGKGQPALAIAPPLVRGENTVYSRTLSWLRQFQAAGAQVRELTVVLPPPSVGIGLSEASFGNLGLLIRVPQVRDFCERSGIRAASVAESGTLGLDLLWRNACLREVADRAKAGIARAVQATFPNCQVSWQQGGESGARTAAPAVAVRASASATRSSSPVTASPAATASQLQPKPGASAPTPDGASSAQVAAAKLATVEKTVADANRALQSIGTKRFLQPWSGGFSNRPNEWRRILDAARDSADLRRFLFGMDGVAQAALATDRRMYVRPARLADIHPDLIVENYQRAGPNSEVNALAMADCGQSVFVCTKGVPLAIMAAFTGNPDYLAKAIEILEAMCDHVPLQRPGWTAYTPTAQIPPGGDGVWLATAGGLNGIVDMLDALGDRVPADLRSRLETLIRNEISRIVADWADARPWYVKGRVVQSNQWLEPTVALIRACLYLGDPDLTKAYDLGVENLAASLAVLGEDGAFPEGMSYAAQTVATMFQALGELKANGDLRCHAFSYVNNAWRWFIQMQMPGGQYVNCYDSRMGAAPPWAIRTPLASLINAAIGSSDPSAISQTRMFFPVGDTSLPAVRYQYALGSSPVPSPGTRISVPTFATFPTQALLVWRSSWEPTAAAQTALGVWVRGGSLTDSHCHRDQGQVSVYCGTRVILMEAGTPSYSDPGLASNYASAAGHGIMQVGELRPHHKPVDVPLSVESLDASGGRVSLDTTPAYQGVTSCRRSVAWNDRGIIEIVDSVSFTETVTAGTEVYRFHSGCTDELTIVGGGKSWKVAWPGASMEFVTDFDVQVSQVRWPDAVTPAKHHQAIVISGVEPLRGLQVRSILRVDFNAK